MIFIDLFYTIQVSKDFNGFVKTNAMIFPVAYGLFVIPFELPFHRSEYIPSIYSFSRNPASILKIDRPLVLSPDPAAVDVVLALVSGRWNPMQPFRDLLWRGGSGENSTVAVLGTRASH